MPPSAAELSLFQRALLRAKRISAVLSRESGDGESDGGNSITCNTADNVGSDVQRPEENRVIQGREAAVRNAFVMQRPPRTTSSGSHKRRPTVVATALKHEDPLYYDVAMTRSIGDWHGPDMVVPHPQIEPFEVPAGRWTRVIMASDGLWDVCEHESAVRLARECSSAQEAAEALLIFAQREYAERGKKGVGDDVTVLCVDLNPSCLPFRPPASEGAEYCCSSELGFCRLC